MNNIIVKLSAVKNISLNLFLLINKTHVANPKMGTMFVYLAKKDNPKMIPDIQNNIFLNFFLSENKKIAIPIIKSELPIFSGEVLA